MKISDNQHIKFGTDGWRGVIAKDFTFANIEIVAQAIVDYIKSMYNQIDSSQMMSVAQMKGTNSGKSFSPTSPTSSKNFLFSTSCPLSPAVIVGYDNRFLSEKFALHTAKVIFANGIDVAVSQSAATSPSVSLYCKKNNCFGIMITASHNPPTWNGLKIKLQYGGSISEKIINEISKFLLVRQNASLFTVWTNGEKNIPISPVFAEAKKSTCKNDVKMDANSETKRADILSDYKKYLKLLVKLNSSSKIKIAVDYMHGSGSGIFESVATNFKKQMIILHSRREPLFNNINPEPIEKNLTELKKTVLENKVNVGFAFDGDADRLGVIDDKGRYLSPHIVFPLILLHLIEGRKLTGKVVQAISLGYLSERIAKKFGLPFEEVPVGFKYVCEKMLTENVLLGGEESGGYGWKNGIPERDGILNALLITEMLSQTKKKLSQLVDDLQKKFGKSYYLRNDIKLSEPVDKQKFVENIEEKIRPVPAIISQCHCKKEVPIKSEQPTRQPHGNYFVRDEIVAIPLKQDSVATEKNGSNTTSSAGLNLRRFGLSIKEIRTYDGIKIVFEDDNWLLLRPSGTEPILRTYSETDSPVKTKKLLDFAKEICFTITNTK
ncbi:MAG: hypothetical protein ABID79_04465 [Elusimicrobiota bacterium]